MAAEIQDVELRVTANTKQAEESLQRLKGATEQASGAMDKKKTSTVNAGGAVISFGRIIQDAPFGIIGVANNITMLSEQFVSLKQQAGSTGAALTAMKSAMLGPLGLTIAISAITTALQFWALQSQKTKKAVDALGDSVKKLVQFKNPFENFVLTFDTKNIDKAISQISARLSDYSYKVSSATGSPSEIDRQDPDKMSKWGANMIAVQKTYVPKIEVLKKVLEYLKTIKKETDTEAQVFETLNGFLKTGLKDEVDDPFEFKEHKDKKPDTLEDKSKSLRKIIEETIETDKLLGKLTGLENFTAWQSNLDNMLKNFKIGSEEYTDILKLKKKVTDYFEIVKLMTETNANMKLDFVMPFDLKNAAKWYEDIDPQKDWWFKGNIQGLDTDMLKEKMKGNDKLFGTSQYKSKFDQDVKDAKMQLKAYEDFFITPFADAFKGEFSKAWQSIFGEANSLFEKFIQGVSEALFNLGVKKAAWGLLDIIFPGAGSLGAAASGGGSMGSFDRKIVNNIIIDNELIATQKQANRIKAHLDRQAALR